MGVEWVDEVPPRPGSRWGSFTAELATKPGEWALAEHCVSENSASCLAHYLRRRYRLHCQVRGRDVYASTETAE